MLTTPISLAFALYLSHSSIFAGALSVRHAEGVANLYSADSRITQNLGRRAECFSTNPSNNIANRITEAFSSGGPGTKISLCPSTTYPLYDTINLTASDQELSTMGYPTNTTRATLFVAAPLDKDNTGMTTAISAKCDKCDGAIIRNIQVDGNRVGQAVQNGSGLLEVGGGTTSQIITHVRSFHPRGFSCLHIIEGPNLSCKNATVTNNDIGPCGTSEQDQWADGISLSCASSIVQNNILDNPTDGGIVVFGSPGSIVKDNVIFVQNETMLGGINLVDFNPWNGNDEGVVVEDNVIIGGIASRPYSPGSNIGPSDSGAIIKIGIAMRPHTWFGDKFGDDVVSGPNVSNNVLSGAMGYGIALSSSSNVIVQGNVLSQQISGNGKVKNPLPDAVFLGHPGPTCIENSTFPHPQAFIANTSLLTDYDIQSNFNKSTNIINLICINSPGSGVNGWPVSSYSP